MVKCVHCMHIYTNTKDGLINDGWDAAWLLECDKTQECLDAKIALFTTKKLQSVLMLMW